jgi:hypothetical protein
MTHMGLMIPKSGNGCNLDKIFEYKLKLNEKDSDKHLIGAEIIAFLKWLIYTAPYKDCNAEPHGPTHALFYKN